MKIDSKSFFNRELSWLAFNTRVLNEAKNTKIPLLERLKLAIAHDAADEIVQPIYTHLNPLLWICSQCEGTIEHKPHYDDKYRKSPDAMRDKSVKPIAPRVAFALRSLVGLF